MSARESVRRLVDEVINEQRLEVLDEICVPEAADAARRWIAPFLKSFPDVHMRTVELVAEGDRVAGRYTCSATHAGDWRGHPPTGRRFEDVDEAYFFETRDGRISGMWGLEDTRDRLRQLGLPPDA